MFSALCRRLLPLALGTGFVFAAAPAFSALGDTASSQARHIATVFPGRMTGTPPEMLSADYLRQQFALMGVSERRAKLQYPLYLYRQQSA